MLKSVEATPHNYLCISVDKGRNGLQLNANFERQTWEALLGRIFSVVGHCSPGGTVLRFWFFYFLAWLGIDPGTSVITVPKLNHFTKTGTSTLHECLNTISDQCIVRRGKKWPNTLPDFISSRPSLQNIFCNFFLFIVVVYLVTAKRLISFTHFHCVYFSCIIF